MEEIVKYKNITIYIVGEKELWVAKDGCLREYIPLCDGCVISAKELLKKAQNYYEIYKDEEIMGNDEKLRQYILKKFKKKQIIEILCEYYDLQPSDFIGIKKEYLVKGYYLEVLKDNLRTWSGKTIQQVYDKLK